MTSRSKLFALAALCVLLVPSAPAFADSEPPCSAAPYHTYDFFLGNWDVYHADGKRFAHDVVTKDMDGCALLERWEDASGKGVGYSAYDAQRKRWVQDFFQNDGTVLTFIGNPVVDGMLFEGTDMPSAGVDRLNRVLFKKRTDGFEELWTTSTDGGHTWKTVFDGYFRPAKPVSP